MHAIVAQNAERIRTCCRMRGVVRLVVFGSVVNDDTFTDSSDVDCVVEFSHEDPLDYGRAFFALLADLQTIFGRRVDLITDRSIRNPAFRAEISEKGQLLYAA